MNMLALTTQNPEAVNQVYNTAFGERTTLNELVGYLKEFLSGYDAGIAGVEILHGPEPGGRYTPLAGLYRQGKEIAWL